MCGQCSNYTEDEVLCEKCVEIRETQKFVDLQSQQLEQPEQPIQTEPTQPAVQVTRKKSSSNILQWLIIAASFAFISFQLYNASNSDFVPIDDETRARELAITSLAECLLVFRRIGEILASDGMPDESLRCDQSTAANIVTPIGNDIQISHPHPDFYGYSQIYVSKNNPEPTLID